MSTIVKTFYAAPGGRINDDDAQIVGKFIDEKCEGAISAEEFVQKAKPKSSPLHPYLEWDDGRAAHQFRLHQARNVINHILVVDHNVPDEKVRAFHQVSLTNGEGRSAYVSHDIVWQQPELIAQVVAQAFRELEAFTRKYRTYEELSHIVSAVEEIVAAKV